jgi:hypothetical protein
VADHRYMIIPLILDIDIQCIYGGPVGQIDFSGSVGSVAYAADVEGGGLTRPQSSQIRITALRGRPRRSMTEALLTISKSDLVIRSSDRRIHPKTRAIPQATPHILL